jgi:hypothetical protein
MKLVEDESAWKIEGDGCYLSTVTFDLGSHLSFEDSANRDWARFTVGNDWELQIGEITTQPTPTRPDSLVPLLGLLQKPVNEVIISKDGHLTVTFASGATIQVAPDERYEAWEAGCLVAGIGYRFVCAPGGEVALFMQKAK